MRQQFAAARGILRKRGFETIEEYARGTSQYSDRVGLLRKRWHDIETRVSGVRPGYAHKLLIFHARCASVRLTRFRSTTEVRKQIADRLRMKRELQENTFQEHARACGRGRVQYELGRLQYRIGGAGGRTK